MCQSTPLPLTPSPPNPAPTPWELWSHDMSLIFGPSESRPVCVCACVSVCVCVCVWRVCVLCVVAVLVCWCMCVCAQGLRCGQHHHPFCLVIFRELLSRRLERPSVVLSMMWVCVCVCVCLCVSVLKCREMVCVR